MPGVHGMMLDSLNDRDGNHDVVVTGIGILTSVAANIEEFTHALRNGICGITDSGEEDFGIMAQIQNFNYEDRLSSLNVDHSIFLRAGKAGRRLPRSAQVSIITALEAWKQAFGDTKIYSPSDINIIVAGTNFNQGYQYANWRKFQQHRSYIPASYALHFMDTDQVGLLSEILGVQGEGLTVGGASASGNVALLQAWRQIRYGLCKACVVIGAMADLSPVEIQAFKQMGAMGGKRVGAEADKACRPFDRDRDGFIYGEGCACLILESAESVRNRDQAIYGRIAGGAMCLDGNRSSDPKMSGEVRAMTSALEVASIEPADIDYVNAHATSSVLGDEIELQALEELFGDHLSNVWVNATKGMVGHCLFAAGLIEAAATLLQMKNGFLHPNLNLINPLENRCRFVGAAAQQEDIHVALKNSFGFGGINTSMVLRT